MTNGSTLGRSLAASVLTSTRYQEQDKYTAVRQECVSGFTPSAIPFRPASKSEPRMMARARGGGFLRGGSWVAPSPLVLQVWLGRSTVTAVIYCLTVNLATKQTYRQKDRCTDIQTNTKNNKKTYKYKQTYTYIHNAHTTLIAIKSMVPVYRYIPCARRAS